MRYEHLIQTTEKYDKSNFFPRNFAKDKYKAIALHHFRIEFSGATFQIARDSRTHFEFVYVFRSMVLECPLLVTLLQTSIVNSFLDSFSFILFAFFFFI